MSRDFSGNSGEKMSILKYLCPALAEAEAKFDPAG